MLCSCMQERGKVSSCESSSQEQPGNMCNIDLFNKSGKQLPHAYVQWHNTSHDNTSQVGKPGVIREGTKHTKLRGTHMLDTTCSSRLGTLLDPSRKQTQHVFFMLKQTTKQLIPRHHDQVGTSFKKGRSWCSNETAPTMPLEEKN